MFAVGGSSSVAGMFGERMFCGPEVVSGGGGRSSSPPELAGADGRDSSTGAADFFGAGFESTLISSFTSDASADAADGFQPPLSSVEGEAAITGTSARTVLVTPPAVNAGSTGTVITLGAGCSVGATITGLDG